MKLLYHALRISLVTIASMTAFAAALPELQTTPAGLKDPRLIKEVQPRYTNEALRARIQGTVVVECVVNPDGRVALATVVRSLDRESGLDDEAIWAARQWRFLPATLNGTAVPVVITIEMTFRIEGRNVRPVRVSWPSAFPGDPEIATAGTWREETMEAPGIRLRVDYPEGWTVDRDAKDGYWIAGRAGDGTRLVGVSQPVPIPQILADVYSEGASDVALNRFRDDLRRQVTAAGGHAQVAKVGQTRFANQRWIWLETTLSTVKPEQLPIGLRPAVQGLDSSATGARVWIFSTAVGSSAVVVYCSLARMPTGTGDGVSNKEKRAGSEFAAILRRISLEPR